ncbi:MAG: hypothetical protein GXO21_03050, partial [Aquificae bacterium]|nr:hypothetical protein [Aquificota bacterium]
MLRYIYAFLLFFYVSFGQEMVKYCSAPPFLQEGTFSNLFLVLDYSGSMADYTYHEGIKEVFITKYNKDKTYYGFFIPDKEYTEKCKRVSPKRVVCYYEIADSIFSLPKFKGSFLNFLYMTRVDILRWILTGGIVDGDYLVLSEMPYIWQDENRQRRIEVRIKLEDAATYDKASGKVKGLLQEIEEYAKRPRVGLLIYGGGKVEGEFAEAESPIIKSWIYPTFDYEKIIKEINNISPSGGTPTGEALDEIKNYFSLKEHIWLNPSVSTKNTYQHPYKFDVDNDGKEELVSCTRNFVVLITDGAWNGHKYSMQSGLICENNSTKIRNPADISVGYACAIDPAKPAYKMWKGGKADLVKNIRGNQNARVYAIAAFLDSSYGLNSIKNTAIYGGFIDIDNDEIPCLYTNKPTPYPECNLSNKVCAAIFSKNCENCGSFLPLPPQTCPEWDNNRDGLPDTYKRGDSPQELKKAITSIFENILKNLASSTSVSAFYSRTKESVIATQSVFYPEKKFEDKNLTWLGYLYSYWFFNSQNIQNLREDSNENKILDLLEDSIIEFLVDDKGLLKVNKYSSTYTGEKKEYIETYTSLDEIKHLWEAGKTLSEKNPEDRELFVGIDGKNIPLKEISIIKEYLGNPDTFPTCLGDTDDEKIYNLIRYIKGEDIKGCRNRTLPNGNVWKLSDIIYSSPKVVNYPEKGFAVVYIGSNGGILHAFRVGYISKEDLGEHQLAKLCNSEGNCFHDKLGEEIWGFIPKNALPYLRYLPDPDYCHIYFVDLTPFIFDYKKRKILIGGMRLG